MNIKICDNCGRRIEDEESFTTIEGKDYCSKNSTCRIVVEKLNEIKRNKEKIKNYQSIINRIESYESSMSSFIIGYSNYGYENHRQKIDVVVHREKEFEELIVDYCNNKIIELAKMIL